MKSFSTDNRGNLGMVGMRRALVTGATGFVGRMVCQRLLDDGWCVRAVYRAENQVSALPGGVDAVMVSSIGLEADWACAFEGVDVVVHLAARVHMVHEDAADSIGEYRKVNVAGTRRLAYEAAAAGVRRFILISSCKVNGEGRLVPYTEKDDPLPEDPYGISKLEAEQALFAISRDTGLEVVIIRPPLVYGPGVKANFLQLMKIVRTGISLPLASIKNRRSLVYIGNLVDAICVCIYHPIANGQVYFVSDGQDVSTPELIRKIAAAFDIPVRLFSFPPLLIQLAGKLVGKSATIVRILGSHVVDTSKIRRDLGWLPPYTMDEGIKETAKWFNNNKCIEKQH